MAEDLKPLKRDTFAEIQIHPRDTTARRWGGEAKMELMKDIPSHSSSPLFHLLSVITRVL